MIERTIKDNVLSLLGSKKAIIIIGARQVGKSTLLQQMLSNRQDVMWLNGDDYDIQELFASMTSTRIRTILGNKKILVFSAFSDTADYLYDNVSQYVKKKYGLDTALITGSVEEVLPKLIKYYKKNSK